MRTSTTDGPHDSLKPLRPVPRLIDLFSGAGGLTAGFTGLFGHSFEPVWANDFNRDAARTYNRNFGDHCVHGDIVDFLEDEATTIPRADTVLGGPPCQGFSLLNKKRDADPRKQLWRPFMEIVERSGADVFLMENVPQLIGSLEHREIREKAESLGFDVRWATLCAADYGVPQTRWRAFILGCRFADPATVFPPRKTHYANGNDARRRFSREFDEYIRSPGLNMPRGIHPSESWTFDWGEVSRCGPSRRSSHARPRAKKIAAGQTEAARPNRQARNSLIGVQR